MKSILDLDDVEVSETGVLKPIEGMIDITDLNELDSIAGGGTKNYIYCPVIINPCSMLM